MIQLREKATRLQFTAGDPSAADPANRVDSYTDSKPFRCSTRSLSGAELVKAGKNSDALVLRFTYDPNRVSFTVGDRISYNNRTYAISYVPKVSYTAELEYFDAEAIDS